MSKSSPVVRRRVVGAVLAGALTGGAYLVFGPSDQRQVLATLRELLSSPNQLPGDTEGRRRQRVESALRRLTRPDVSLAVPELGVIEGRDGIIDMLDSAQGTTLELRIEQSDVRVAADGASATLLVALTTTTLGERRKQVRTLSTELSRVEGGFAVWRIAASGPSREQPEARP